MNEQLRFLDKDCATAAQTVGDGASEDVIARTLGVLQEDGVYAFFIYVQALQNKQASRKEAEAIWNGVAGLLCTLGKVNVKEDLGSDKLGGWYSTICGSLDALFFIKEMMERTLIYARYYAKAKPKENSLEK